MYRVDRQQFIDAYNGDLLVRNKEGVVTHLGDAAILSLEAVERGEMVELTIQGRVVSTFKDGTETLVEERL